MTYSTYPLKTPPPTHTYIFIYPYIFRPLLLSVIFPNLYFPKHLFCLLFKVGRFFSSRRRREKRTALDFICYINHANGIKIYVVLVRIIRLPRIFQFCTHRVETALRNTYTQCISLSKKKVFPASTRKRIGV